MSIPASATLALMICALTQHGFAPGRMFAANFRQSLITARGDPLIFVQRPVSLLLLVISAVLLIAIPDVVDQSTSLRCISGLIRA